MIRVWLTRLGTRSSLSFTATCAYYVDGNTARPIPAGAQATVEAIGGELYLTVDGALTALGAFLHARARAERHAGPALYIARRRQPLLRRSAALVSGGSIVPILRIYIEDYPLRRGWAMRLSNSWPLESAQGAGGGGAQLRAALHMSSRASRAYHVVDTTADQVFRGYNGSYGRVIQAVNETARAGALRRLRPRRLLLRRQQRRPDGGHAQRLGGNLSYSTVKDDPYDLANPSAKAKSAAIRRDATGLDARLSQALLDGAAAQGAQDASIVAILDIEPHTPKYAAPAACILKLRFTIEVMSASGARCCTWMWIPTARWRIGMA